MFVRWQEGDSLATPLDIRVSEASVEAAAAVLDAGGSLTLVYYNALGLRALLKPEKWAAVGKPLPRFVRWGGGWLRVGCGASLEADWFGPMGGASAGGVCSGADLNFLVGLVGTLTFCAGRSCWHL